MSSILTPTHHATVPNGETVHEGLGRTTRHAWASRTPAAMPRPVPAGWCAAELRG
jgi:hypothetical protein